MTRQTIFRLLHGLWALPCLAASIWLTMATEGHPPGIIYVPFVLAIWAVGHLLLWGTHKLARRGLAKRVGLRITWPIPVVIALVGSGTVTFLGILFVGAALLQRKPWNPWDLMILATVSAHPPAFVGLLLRAGWARFYSAALAAGWSLLMLYQMIETLWRGGKVKLWEWPVAAAIVIGFGALAWAMLKSPRVAEYFE